MDEQEVQHESTYDAMAAVLREVGVIAKSRTTDSQNENFKFAFRGIEELLEVVNPLCKKHGLLTPPVMVGDPIVGEYQTRNSTMHWVMVPTAIAFQATADKDDVIMAGPFLGEAGDAGDKAATKAQSVAWREIMFKTFNVPTRGDDYDTEQGDQEDKAAISQAEKEAAALAYANAKAQERGWAGLDELDEAWEDLKGFGEGGSESAQWARTWASAHKTRKGTLTAAFFQEMEATLANAKQDGNWKANYTPPEVEA
jgi:hypothetical protein